MKKMRKYEEGGDVEFESKEGQNSGIDDETRARAKARVAGTLQDETGKESKIRRNTETGELYDTDTPKAKPKAAAKPAPKAEPKKETYGNDRRSEKQKAAGEEPSFLKGTKGYNLSDVTRFLRRKAGITSYKSGGSVSSASKRADGCAIKGKTKGRMV
jgi:hypothetical protein